VREDVDARKAKGGERGVRSRSDVVSWLGGEKGD